jgi:hypothetical protein
MRRKPLAALLLAPIAVLGFAASAQALSVPGPGLPIPPTLLAAPFEEEEEEVDADASEDEELEAEACEDGEEAECEEWEHDAQASTECPLTGVEATVLASGNRDRIRLQVRYASAFPTAVSIAYGLRGADGSLFLGSARKRFDGKGVLRLDRGLTEAQMVKVMAARDFTVRIRALEAPGRCQAVVRRHLNVRRATPNGLSWRQRD